MGLLNTERRLDEVNDELLKANAHEVFPEVIPPDSRQDSPRASNDNGVKFQTKERRRSSLVKDDFSDLDLEEDFESYYDGYEGRGTTRRQGRKTNEQRGWMRLRPILTDLKPDFKKQRKSGHDQTSNRKRGGMTYTYGK
jgi:hypothetical protein